MSSKQSYYGEREVPAIHIQMHPNNPQSVAIKEKKVNNMKKVSQLTI
jgi:hypothetical protein